jgi:nitrogen regulatory protein PII
MKAVLIIFNQAHTERVEYMLEKLGIRGFTNFPTVLGQGSVDGDPHLGTHTWPEINSGMLSIVDDEKVDMLLEKVQKLDAINKEVGIRAFVWDILKTV